MTPTEHGRLFQLKLHRNAVARLAAYATVRECPDGRWQARLGGRLRGRTETFLSRRLADEAVDAYYNEAAVRFNRELDARLRRVIEALRSELDP